jgi:uncharacterized LabA/DUF88 family protein
VRYFTAPVGGDAGARQNIWFRALETLTPLSVHKGVYQDNIDIRPLAEYPAKGMATVLEHCAGPGAAWEPMTRPHPGEWVRASIVDTEEKGSDVNLATYLIFDGMRNKYDSAIVVSGDSDLVEPIRLCNSPGIGKHVAVVNPRTTFSKELNDVAAGYEPLDVTILGNCHLPHSVLARNGSRLMRPRSW